MRNQRSFRTKSRLKVVDNSVKVSQVIGKKDSNGQPFYPSFTNLTVVLVTEDKRTYETTKATADGLGNITFLKRGLADDGTDTEVAKFKRAWMPGTLMFVTVASEDIESKQDTLVAGCNITICGNTISATDTTYQSCDFDINDLGDSCSCKDYWNCAIQPNDNISCLCNDVGYTTCTGTVTACDLACYAQCCDLGCAAFTNQYCDLSGQPTIGSANLILQKNGTDIDCFNANATVDKCINITVPTQACDICAMPDSVKYGASVDLTIDSSTFVVTSQLKDQDGCSLGSACTIDLPLESVVVDGCYNSCTKEIELTLQNCCQICFSVADLVSGLQTEITCSNKLSSDLVDDSGHTNLFVDCTEKCCISSALQPNDNVSSLCNDAGYTTCTGTLVACDIANLAQCCDIPTDNCQLGNGCGYTTCTGTVTSSDLACYAQCCDMVCNLTGADHCHYPSAKAVADALSCAGAGDMLASTYDPCNCNADAFDYCNFSNTPDLNCYQEKLTAGNNITINANTISGDFNYAEPTTAAACTTKCVCIPEITQLCAGQTIIVKPTITATNCATNIKLNSFDAYPVRFNNAALTSTTDGYVRGANQLAQFVFDGSYWHVVGKSYDANTTYTMNNSVDAGQYKAGSGTYAITRYSLVMEKDNGTWEKITATNATYSTGTSKSVNTSGFKLGHIRYYSGSSTFANGALVTTNVFSNKAASVSGAYSFNCGTAPGWAVGTYIYLVGTIGVDGLFYLDTTQWWATQLPSAKDGKLYIRLGLSLKADDSTFSFLEDRPIYYYDNGIKVYGQADNKQDKISDLDTIRTGAACGATAAQPGDIPTDNCQLGNGCGYTTCTGTLTSSDISGLVAESCIACINGCCLTNGGDICVGGGGGGTVMCECCYDPGDYQQDFLYFTY